MSQTLIIIISAIVFAQTKPASQMVVDLSSPRTALISFRRAVAGNDEDALVSTVYVADPSQGSLIEAQAKLILSSRSFAEAVASRFADSGDALAAGVSRLADVKLIDAAKVTINAGNDNDATAMLASDLPPMVLHRGSDQLWRIDLPGFMGAGVHSPEEQAQQTALLTELARALDSLRKDVNEGRFNTVVDVKAAVQDRVHSAIARSLRRGEAATRSAATQPASSPTTSPTTDPS